MAAKLANMQQGDRDTHFCVSSISQPQAAELLNVSTRTDVTQICERLSGSMVEPARPPATDPASYSYLTQGKPQTNRQGDLLVQTLQRFPLTRSSYKVRAEGEL